MQIDFNLHDAIFKSLKGKRKENKYAPKDRELNFVLRKTNRFKRLTQGYWFYGNDYYLMLSFWDGMDWKRKVPNICLGYEGNYLFVEFCATDNQIKENFIREHIEPLFESYEELANRTEFRKRKYCKAETIEEILEGIESFLKTEKQQIDQIMLKMLADDQFPYYPPYDVKLDFISNREFDKNNRNVVKYRRVLIADNLLKSVMYGVKELNICNYKSIKNLDLNFSINNDEITKWIFLTGENGSGKTSILQSIVIGLQGNRDGNLILYIPPNKAINPEKKEDKFNIELKYIAKGEEQLNSIDFSTMKGINEFPDFSNYAAYGPSRLEIKNTDVLQTIDRTGKTYSLFHDDGYLLNIQDALYKWILLADKDADAKEKLGNIKDIFLGKTDDESEIGLLPQVEEIDVIDGEIKYKVEGRSRWMSYNHLSTGNKNIIAMIGDMILRFFNELKTNDPAQFCGIVLIDEIDAHIHPKWQKELISQLETIFPEIQFIVTSHSPIPFLGLEDVEKSILFSVERDELDEIRTTQFPIHKLRTLTPNAILTSPVFDFWELFPDSLTKDLRGSSVDDYSEDVFREILSTKIKALDNKLFKGNESNR